MPIYEFECKKCKAHLEVFQKLNDKQPTRCRKCGGRLEKLVSASAFQFKGTGWYVTDYASKSAKAKRSEDKKSDKGETASTTSETKSESKEASPAKKTTDTASSQKPSKGD